MRWVLCCFLSVGISDEEKERKNEKDVWRDVYILLDHSCVFLGLLACSFFLRVAPGKRYPSPSFLLSDRSLVKSDVRDATYVLNLFLFLVREDNGGDAPMISEHLRRRR